MGLEGGDNELNKTRFSKQTVQLFSVNFYFFQCSSFFFVIVMFYNKFVFSFYFALNCTRNDWVVFIFLFVNCVCSINNSLSN